MDPSDTPARIGRYRILSRVGAGGMGTVYRARDEMLARDVALKVLPTGSIDGDEERRARFLREARALAALSHPNVAAVLDVGADEGMAFLVMELVEGPSLRDRLRRGRLTPKEAVVIALDVARGLGAAHARGIVHRDIKPDNVVLGEDGRGKLVDFGLAKSLGTSADSASTGPAAAGSALTVDGAILGTPQYMAPEQARGAAIDARADVFSFGALLYELLAHRPAYAASSVIEALVAVQTEDAPSLGAIAPHLPDDLARFVHACLARDPTKRPADGRELVLALERLGLDGIDAEASRSDLGLAETMASSESLEKLSARTAARAAAAAVESASIATPRAVTSNVPEQRRARRWVAPAAVAVFAALAVAVVFAAARPETEPLALDTDPPEPPRITPLDVRPVPGAGRISLLRDGSGVALADRGSLRVVGWDGVRRASIPVATEYAVVGETLDGRFLVTVASDLIRVGVGFEHEPLGESMRRARLAPDGLTLAVEDGESLSVGPIDDPSSRTVVFRTSQPILFSWSPDSSRLIVGELDVAGTRRDVSLFVVGADGTRGPILREGTELAGPFGPSLGWLDPQTIVFARHVEGGADVIALGVDAAGRANGEERVILGAWSLGFPTELVASGPHVALVATHETRTLLEADVRPDGSLATPRALFDEETALQPIGYLADGTRVVATYDEGWRVTTLGDDDSRVELASIGGDVLAASTSGDALVYLRPTGDRRWELVRRTNAGETVIVPASEIAACDAPLLDCTAAACVIGTAAATEIELQAFDPMTGDAIGPGCVTAPGAAGAVRTISVEPREPLAVVFARNADHRLVRVEMTDCAVVEREIAGASLQFLDAAADGTVVATSISRASAERRIVRIGEASAEPTLLLSENAWLYRPVLADDGARLFFARRNDRASAFLIDLTP